MTDPDDSGIPEAPPPIEISPPQLDGNEQIAAANAARQALPPQATYDGNVKNAGAQIIVPKGDYKSRMFWLGYFWVEAKAAADTVDDFQRVMVRIYESLFEPDANRAWHLKDLNRIPEGQFLEILAALLELGFEELKKPIGDLGNNALPSNMIGQARHGREHMHVEIGWRGESRPWYKIIMDEGTKRTVDLGDRAAEKNISAPWHPWSLPKYKDSFWFRRNQKDNCLYTVVSVGSDFETVTAFPLIVEKSVYDFPTGPNGLWKPLANWQQEDLQKHRANLAIVRLSDGSSRLFVTTTIYVYMFLLKGPVLDTKAAQLQYGPNVGFPEKGVKEINLDDIYACFQVVRVHHGLEQTNGHTAIIQKAWHTFDSKKERKIKYGDALEQLEEQYQRVCKLKPFATAWAYNGRGPAIAIRGKDKQTPVTPIGFVEFPLVNIQK